MRRTYEEMKYFKMELQNREVNFNSKFGAQPRVGTLNPLASQRPPPTAATARGAEAPRRWPRLDGGRLDGACGLGGGVGGGVDARVQMPTGGGGGAVGGGAVGGGAVGGGAGAPGPPMGEEAAAEAGAWRRADLDFCAHR